MDFDEKENGTHTLEEQLENAPVAVSRTSEEEHVTLKTWLVITVGLLRLLAGECLTMDNQILSMQFGTAFWPIPAVTAVGSTVAKDLGDATAATWYVTSFVLAVCISFMTCGANSDLFGRRNFILLGNVLTFVSRSQYSTGPVRICS